MTLDAYIRVSRVNGRSGPSFISPDVQRDAIAAWAKANGATIAQWHEELDRSAGEGKSRPVFDALLERATSGATNGIVVWKLSRFGRSLIEAASRIRDIEAAGGEVHSATEGTQSRLTRNILLAVAEDELERLTETRATARERAVERGVWVGPAPLGYRRNDTGALVVDKRRAPLVVEAFKVAGARGLHAAGAYLEGALPGMRWRTSDVRRVLRNRAYLGEHHEAGGPGHEALVDEQVFAAAQTEPRGRRTNGDYALTGLLECAVCGGPMTGWLQTVKGRTYRRYRCSDCHRCAIGADALEAHLADIDEVVVVQSSPDAGLEAARVALDAARADLGVYVTTVSPGAAGADAYAAGLRVWSEAAELAEGRYQAAAAADARTAVTRADESALVAGVRRVLDAGFRITVAGGRGAVEERVEVVGVDDVDHAVWVAAA